MGRAHREEAVRTLLPVVVSDHDGFASDGLDGEPSVCWPAKFRAREVEDTPLDRWNANNWNCLVERGGPPLYGVEEK
jgi:hypothetical protein